MKEEIPPGHCPTCGEEMGEAFGSRRLYCDKCHPEQYARPVPTQPDPPSKGKTAEDFIANINNAEWDGEGNPMYSYGQLKSAIQEYANQRVQEANERLEKFQRVASCGYNADEYQGGIGPLPQTSPPAPDKWPSIEDAQIEAERRYPRGEGYRDEHACKRTGFVAAINWIKEITTK